MSFATAYVTDFVNFCHVLLVLAFFSTRLRESPSVCCEVIVRAFVGFFTSAYSIGCLLIKWEKRLDVLSPLAEIDFPQRRQIAVDVSKTLPSGPALKPKYVHGAEVVLLFDIRPSTIPAGEPSPFRTACA